MLTSTSNAKWDNMGNRILFIFFLFFFFGWRTVLDFELVCLQSLKSPATWKAVWLRKNSFPSKANSIPVEKHSKVPGSESKWAKCSHGVQGQGNDKKGRESQDKASLGAGASQAERAGCSPQHAVLHFLSVMSGECGLKNLRTKDRMKRVSWEFTERETMKH